VTGKKGEKEEETSEKEKRVAQYKTSDPERQKNTVFSQTGQKRSLSGAGTSQIKIKATKKKV